MARPPLEPQTELAVRLCMVRQALDFKERKQFAAHLGIFASTLGNYETGAREPPASVLALYKNTCGVSTDWLLTGEGEMFTDAAAVPANQRAVDVDVMARIAARVDKTFEQLNRVPAETQVTIITAQIYNELLADEIDFDDEEELEPAIAVQIAKLKKRMINEPNNLSTAVA